jgi:hypothetical protein|tara:strand:- start:12563 stop:12820 length:258 start_codon:yes stop_codon:yes gene_type:complete
MKETEDLSKVKVQIACCAKCGGTILVCVANNIDKRTAKEFASMMVDGCDIKLTNVIVARTHKWCSSDNGCEGMWPKKTKNKTNEK